MEGGEDGAESPTKRSGKSLKRKATVMKNLFGSDDSDDECSISGDNVDEYIRSDHQKEFDEDKDEGEAFSDFDEDDEALGFTFVGLNKRILAEECPTSQGVRFVKDALKQALEDNEVEEGASKIVMESVRESSKVKVSAPDAPAAVSGEQNTGTTSAGSRDTAVTNEDPTGSTATKKQAAEQVKEAKAMKSWEEFMNERIKLKIMSRIDELNEQNPAYKMLLQDERSNDTRMVVTVELIKYLKWLKVKLETNRDEFYCSQQKSKEKNESESDKKTKVPEQSSSESGSKCKGRSARTSNDANGACGEKDKSPIKNGSKSTPAMPRTSPRPASKNSSQSASISTASNSGGFKTPSPKKNPPTSSAGGAQSPLDDFYSMFQSFNEPSPEKTGPARFTRRSMKSNSRGSEEPETILGITSNLASPPKRQNDSSTREPAHQLPQSDAAAKQQFDILNAELEELMKAQKRELESEAPPDLHSLLDDFDSPGMDFNFMEQMFE